MNARNLQIIGLILMAGLLIAYFGYDRVKSENMVKNGDDSVIESIVLKQNWQERPVGETGLSVLTPEDLREVNIVLDDRAKKEIEAYHAYIYDKKSFAIRINHIALHERKPYQSKEYATELAKAIKSSPESRSFEYEIIPVSKDGIVSHVVDGETKKNKLFSVVIERENKLWEVTVSYSKTSEKLKELSDSIFKSIKLK